MREARKRAGGADMRGKTDLLKKEKNLLPSPPTHTPIALKATKITLPLSLLILQAVSNLPYAPLDLESLVNALSFYKEITLLR